jgi:hypothetical protein
LAAAVEVALAMAGVHRSGKPRVAEGQLFDSRVARTISLQQPVVAVEVIAVQVVQVAALQVQAEL